MRNLLIQSSVILCLIGAEATALPPSGPQLLGVHPDAVLQPTTRGATLHTLHAAGGKIYIGYGDYSDDHGPISMRHFDPTTGMFSNVLISSNTEAIHRIRVIGNDIWAPTTDPLGFQQGGYIRGPVSGSGSWTSNETLDTVHFFDVSSYAGNSNQLFLSGSGGPTNIRNSILYESQNGGTSWSVALDLPVPNNVPANAFTRFYGIGELNNKLYVQHSQLGSGFVPLSMYVYDGTSWTQTATPTTAGNQAISFVDPDVFGNEIIVRDFHSGLSAGPTFRFDGTQLTELLVPGTMGNLAFWDHYVTQNKVFMLTDEQTVIVSDDLTTWSVVADNLPSTARSLAVIGDSIYLGTSDSSLYQVTAIPEPVAWKYSSCVVAVLLAIRARRILKTPNADG